MLQKSEIVASKIEWIAEIVVSEIEWIVESIGLKFNAGDLTRPGQRPGEFITHNSENKFARGSLHK